MLCAPGFPTSADDPHKTFLLDHARALADAGIRVSVVCPAHPGAPRRQVFEAAAGIDVHRVRFAPAGVAARIARGDSRRQFSGPAAVWVLPLTVALTWKAARLARAGAQVVHGHWWFPCGAAAVAAGRLGRARSVVHVHGTDLELTRGAVSRAAARLVGMNRRR
ncbi:MAG TPA: hypothetical protein DEP66_00625, partial [Acidimicrobiaceae bacterium]|nr:hypothetical protein [Acidimicrobiaceae bacterium]